ncbi:Gfo/Idh/MocA family oxidoreductase [Sulfurovum sp. zt1-1]|uniref:Gfo/Idh/MocA family oxidoreductase n=1 Tax=Sulfurovum zhangzhouensis TaxID=3019067 RepID=A0ABT7QYH2_9BACT|nr:Gfo/Idh/MocA family oxidoreductase [Sulfurovum zhangzhouensis]MDM5271880.1 Gfo/Idh/MocA family oxidoreductase [Sulfurovum zhangzhouensis]
MIDVLIVGIGEYVTGLSGEGVAKSDKSFGVIALSLFDMRERGLVGEIHLAGRDAKRFDLIWEHFDKNLKSAYPFLDTSFHAYPEEGYSDEAYKEALNQMQEGSCVMIFTPDDTHFQIAKDALEAGMHVLVAKPLVKTTTEHLELQRLAKEKGLLLMLEVHKRFDPIYADAVDQIRTFGDFSLMHSYMSQPKTQLDTFASWAGISSDISYYLNAHHIDLLCWAVQDFAKPVSVVATASTGVADKKLEREVEDTITLTVQWENLQSGALGTSVHTASWIAPPSDVHSQQRFFYMGHTGEVNIDQAHRGYGISTDRVGYKSANPLFMKYTPRNGKFAGQQGYGYQSIETFVRSSDELSKEPTKLAAYNKTLPTIENTLNVTKILEAGRKSLDEGKVIFL